MEILTGEQMRRIDRRAIDEMGLPGLELMEAAGRGVARALAEDYPASAEIVVLCGRGNNGGDGLVAARHLAGRGAAPRVLLLSEASRLAGDAAASLAAARAAGLEVREVPDEAAWIAERDVLRRGVVVLDAMLGTGVRGGARGLVARVIEDLERHDVHVVALDLPSGIDADSTELPGPAVRAERTYTLCRPKLPLVLGAAAERAGRWRVVPIGIPDAAVAAEGVDLEWLDDAAVRGILAPRPADCHKGSFGHLLAVAGSRDKSGAAVLVGRAALRCGAGLVTVATPASAQARVAVQQAELMTEPLPETAQGTLAGAAAERVEALSASRTALALGPGLGVEPATVEAARRIVGGAAGRSLPSVVDADGLTALAPLDGSPGPPRGEPCQILTPHPGEAARLLDTSAGAIQADRLAAARELARRSGRVVVLKGHRTLVSRPDGRVAVNGSGNPAMATAGTGDVLTGAVGAFLARGVPAWSAARLAVRVHGDAGDAAAREQGVEGLIASDVVDRLGPALDALVRGDAG